MYHFVLQKNKFEVKTEGRKFAYYTAEEKLSKYLLTLCRTSHEFHMSVQPRLAEIKHLEEEDKRYQEAYVYCETNESSWEHDRSSLPSRSSIRTPLGMAPAATLYGGSLTATARRSLVSTSSNTTTSGIVSDRTHASLDDSEGDCIAPASL